MRKLIEKFLHFADVAFKYIYVEEEDKTIATKKTPLSQGGLFLFCQVFFKINYLQFN
ncbi:hypothetical protein [Desulforamulus ruminis]|uniref:Uncharacterized protein n=1 Tax=Desulforamulus ruminis (strain ATCC 23193 / DSM 2154 / NCIMB 8452 / DL) TaxID=696281 RepID=F6DS94_DESRL|nr:hypothetical protein [Desulforamulus ruminis]AEG59873.1 hypothetical protein Desru_1608 [Desulforamulus ruminis DSM 2154]